jgi:hypothetical protein
MKKQNNISKKNNITFGILFSIFFFVISFYIFKLKVPGTIWLFFSFIIFILSLTFLIITIIKPSLFTFLNRLWIQLGILFGKIISPIVMGLIFFFVLTPIGILVKIFKKDVMSLKIGGASSYWITRKDKVQSMNKQF